MPKKTQKTISQTALKHYKQFRSVRIEALRWLQLTTDTGEKSKLKQQSNKEIKNYCTLLPLM